MSEQLALAIDPMRTALVFVRAKPDLFRKDFEEYLERNWHVWEAFEQEANKVWARGRTHYSHRTIFEHLRHETAMREQENQHGWKLNDWYVKDLARLYVMHYPDRNMFEFRNGQSAVRAA